MARYFGFGFGLGLSGSYYRLVIGLDLASGYWLVYWLCRWTMCWQNWGAFATRQWRVAAREWRARKGIPLCTQEG